MAFTEKYVTVTGGGLHDGSSEANAWTLAEGFANYAAGDRVNIKAGTYATTAMFTLSTSGSAASPVVFRGYKTTIGDIDDWVTSQRVPATDVPNITGSGTYTGILTSSNIGHISLQNLSFEYNNSNPVIYANNHNLSPLMLIRCRIKNDNSSCTWSNRCVLHAINCHYSSSSTTNSLHYTVQSGSGVGIFNSCVFDGGGKGYIGRNPYAINTVFKNQAIYAIDTSTSEDAHIISNCTFYNAGSNFINGGDYCAVSRCVFDTCGGFAVSGVDSKHFLFNNAYHDSSFTSGRLSINDGLDIEPVTLTSSPFVDAASGDLTIDSASPAYGKGLLFENDQTSYADIGAIQHQDPSGGGGSQFHPLG